MKAARCAPALGGGKPNDLAADTASHRLNFLAARRNGTESPPKRPAIRRMSVKRMGMTAEQQASIWSQTTARHQALTELPAETKMNMKAETCTPESRARIESNLAK